MGKRALGIVLAVVVIGAVAYIVRLQSQLSALQTGSETKRAPSGAAPGAPAPPRTLTDDQKQAMLGVLKPEDGTTTTATRRVWFQVEQGRAEPVAVQKALEQVFREAGWQVDTKGASGMTFKPGVYMLVGDEDWPQDASTAFQAFQIAGIDVKAGSGYRDYYEQQKKEKPGWTGPKLA